MPVIHLSAQQIHNIRSPSLVPLAQAQFLLTLAASIVGPIGLLALAVSLSRKYKTPSRPALALVRPMPAAREWVDHPKHSQKSNAVGVIMSVNRKSEIPPYWTHGVPEEDRVGSRGDLSQSPSHRQKYQEELGARKADTDELRNFKAQPPKLISPTPPVLSTTFFTLQDRRLSVAASTHGDFDPTLSHGTNSDSNSPESMMTTAPHARASSPTSLRKSYSKAFPLDPHQLGFSADAGTEDAPLAFAPSSFPSSSPILPLAPHAALESREVDVAGGFVSAMDDSGDVWKRHTRVYGGGVCLACMASGDSHGGFYGDNVPMDQRR
ncbi:hypothetical protein F5Y14DRAFT_366234 [Nemania sp. NC0429]|nr:hypothetical protein F5Y14DRAFT_366234 [Nemania sp. NC0429]